jgi:hypothetical protein
MSPWEADKINTTATKVNIAGAGVDAEAFIVAQVQPLVLVDLLTTTIPEATSLTV